MDINFKFLFALAAVINVQGIGICVAPNFLPAKFSPLKFYPRLLHLLVLSNRAARHQ